VRKKKKKKEEEEEREGDESVAKHTKNLLNDDITNSLCGEVSTST
jgi:hypothetical protein